MIRLSYPISYATIVVPIFALVVCIGCSNRPKRISAPGINATQAGKDAILELDTNNDAELSKDELAKAPAFDFGRIDTDENGSLSAAEITARIKQWQSGNVGLNSHLIVIQLDGRPLVGAQVDLEPYSFLGSDVLPATGITDEIGMVAPAVAEQFLPHPNILAMHSGFYKIRVSKKAGDKELIPDRYNTDTELGCEVASDFRSSNEPLQLRSK